MSTGPTSTTVARDAPQPLAARPALGNNRRIGSLQLLELKNGTIVLQLISEVHFGWKKKTIGLLGRSTLTSLATRFALSNDRQVGRQKQLKL